MSGRGDSTTWEERAEARKPLFSLAARYQTLVGPTATQTGATLHYLAAAAARLPGGSDGLLDRLPALLFGFEVVQLGQPPQPPAYPHGQPAALAGVAGHPPLPEVRADVGEQRPGVVPVHVSGGSDHGRPPAGCPVGRLAEPAGEPRRCSFRACRVPLVIKRQAQDAGAPIRRLPAPARAPAVPLVGVSAAVRGRSSGFQREPPVDACIRRVSRPSAAACRALFRPGDAPPAARR